jgi:hypothetical protein
MACHRFESKCAQRGPEIFSARGSSYLGALVARWKDGGLRLGHEAGASTLLLGLGGTRHCAIGVGGG